MKDIVYIAVLFFTLFHVANSLCSHPCSRVNRGTFTDGTRNFVFGCTNTSVLQVYEGNRFIEDRECYARSGPFLVFRVGSRYQCFKDTVVDPNTNVVMIYFAPTQTFSTNPSICDVCAGEYTFALFVPRGNDLEAARRLPRPPLGCNRPPNCPILPDPYYIPCTGCEPKEDDGLCCSSCQDNNNVYNRYGRGNQDRRNRDRRGRSNRFIGSLTQSFNNGRYSRPTKRSAKTC